MSVTSNVSLNMDFSRLPVSKLTGKPVIHFAHANGMPSRVYQPLFEVLEQYFTVEYIATLGFDEQGQPTYAIDNHWKSLTNQVIDSVQKLVKKHKVPVIGWGHSLGALCTLQAIYRKPKLFVQAVLMDPPLIYGKDNFLWHTAKLVSPKKVDKMSPAGVSKTVVMCGTVVSKLVNYYVLKDFLRALMTVHLKAIYNMGYVISKMGR